MEITRQSFGQTAAGEAVDLYTLANDLGMQVKIMNYGGTVISILTPDRDGNLGEVTLGFDKLALYEQHSAYYGCIVGRFANRIGNSRFTLDGVEYVLAQNDGENHLHGGQKGFDKVVWTAEELRENDRVGLRLSYLSVDGEENYPGNLDVQVVYTLDNDNAITIDYTATTDKKTVINLTNHTYFNLSGGATILGHELMIPAQQFIHSNEGLIPTGKIIEVAGTPLDFTRAQVIGARIDQEDENIQTAGGYDHSYILQGDGEELVLAAVVHDPESGRILETYTTEPDIHFYSGNFLNEKIPDRQGNPLQKRAGFCLEAQHYPDSPNNAHFPSTVLEPGQVYRQRTIYKFPPPQ